MPQTPTHPAAGAPPIPDDRGLAAQLAEIEAADLDGLRALWRGCYGPPPRLRSVNLMRLSLAWRLQADAHGGLPREMRRKLQGRAPLQAEGLNLGTGARLRREWNGRMVEVVVEDAGFRWNGTLYRSLSAAATAIAGSRWNGPRFFGFREGR